jgi:hypothetical protein
MVVTETATEREQEMKHPEYKLVCRYNNKGTRTFVIYKKVWFLNFSFWMVHHECSWRCSEFKAREMTLGAYEEDLKKYSFQKNPKPADEVLMHLKDE